MLIMHSCSRIDSLVGWELLSEPRQINAHTKILDWSAIVRNGSTRIWIDLTHAYGINNFKSIQNPHPYTNFVHRFKGWDCGGDFGGFVRVSTHCTRFRLESPFSLSSSSHKPLELGEDMGFVHAFSFIIEPYIQVMKAS